MESDISSTVGQSATVVEQPSEQLMADKRLVEVSEFVSPPPAVLVVNDREVERVATRVMLDPLGLVVIEADSGRAALGALWGRAFALILMDVRMPIMDGYETAKRIRQRSETTRTPIMFLTAFGREDTETLAAYASGAVDFIVTPVLPEILRSKVSVFVDLFLQSQKLERSLDAIMNLNAALRDSEASTRAVLNNVADGILTAGEGGLMESVNRSARRLLGYSEEDLIGRPLVSIIAPARRDEFRGLATAHGRLIDGGTPDRASETLGCRQDGSTFPMEVERGELQLADRRLTLAFVRDISARKAYTDHLEHQALHDGLTGLATRTLFAEHVRRALASAKRGDETRGVLVMDLDGFKHINDTLGHEQGDILLDQVAKRLVAALREADTVARLGGDEFAILPGGLTDLAAAATVARKVQQTCAAGFVLNDEVVHVSMSVGIAMFPAHGDTTADLLRRADMAMYDAKRSGGGWRVFHAAQETQTTLKLALLGDLRRCVARDELVLHYQPKVDLGTAMISGVEALVRWRHPTHGLLLPAGFMPEVERTELLEPVTRWVLDEALRQQQSWRNAGMDLTMAVNISARSLRHSSNLPDTVEELTETWGTAPNRLTLELTEGALIEASTPNVLARLHDMGQKMSIDDFGVGYSSVACLQRLPVDELKIDRSFVTHLSDGNDDAVIVRSAIDLAHSLDLTVVAEGVEDAHVLQMLASHQCDAAQGYFFSRPCGADELTAWLSRSPYRVRFETSSNSSP